MVLEADRRVLALGLARMADALGNSFLIIVLPLYIAGGEIALGGLTGTRILGLAVTEEFLVGLVLSLFGLLNSLLQPTMGKLSDRVGARKPFILAGLTVFGVASAAYPFAHTYLPVLVIRALQGVGAALTIPATIALVNEYAADDTQRGNNFGVFNTFRLIGFGFGPIVAGVLVTGGFASGTVVTYRIAGVAVSGFVAAFAVAVLGAAVSFALVSLVVFDPPEVEAEASDDLSIRVLAVEGDGLLDSVFVVGLGTFFMATGIAIFATLQEIVNAELGQGPFLFSVQFAAVVIANVLLQVPFGRWSDRIGRRPFLLGGFALLVPSLVVQGYTPELAATLPPVAGVPAASVVMLAARLLQGVAVAMVFAPGLALAGDLARAGRSGTTLSVLTTAFGFGVALGPLASGFLVRYGFAVPFLFAAGLSVIAFVLTRIEVEESLGTVAEEPAGEATPQDD